MSASQTIAITGVNGFVAAHVASYFLEKGWHVRGSVRSQERVDEVKSNPNFQKWIGNGALEVVIISDLIDGDFSPLFNGVDAVAHIAAPVREITKGGDWPAFRDPTINGTNNLLTQAAKFPKITVVSVISSMAAVAAPGDITVQATMSYSEKDYFPLEEAQLEGLNPEDFMSRFAFYCGVKKLLELRAAETHEKLGKPYALSFVVPPMVYGPLLTYSSESKSSYQILSTTDQLSLIAGADADLIPTFTTCYVDGRDVGQAFYLLITSKKEGRYLIASGDFDWETVAVALRKARPQYASYIPIPKKKGVLETIGGAKVDTSKSVNELGMKYTPFEKTWTDMIDDLAANGVIRADSA